MRAELSRIHDETDLTIVHVTHNQTEALSMADRIAVINGGRLEQLDPAKEVYANPQTPFVAEFIGNTTMLGGVVDRVGTREAVATVGGGEVAFQGGDGLSTGQSVQLGLRAEKVRIDTSDPGTDNAFDGTIGQVSFEGEQTQYVVDVDALDTRLEVTHQNPEPGTVFERGDTVTVGWAAEDIFAYPE